MVALGEISPEAGDPKRNSKWAEAAFQAKNGTSAVLGSDSVCYKDSGLGCSCLQSPVYKRIYCFFWVLVMG